MATIVVDRIGSYEGVVWPVDRFFSTGLRIRFVKRRSCACYGDSYSMAFIENLTDPSNVKIDWDYFIGYEQYFFIETLAVS